jgi:uncharacterized protein
MEYRVRVNLFWTAVVIALGMVVSIVTSTIVVSRSLNSRLKQQAERAQDITVKGSARTRVKSDTGVWQIAVEGESKDLKEAFAILDAGVGKLRGFLDTQGFKPAEISVSSIVTTTHYAHDQHDNETREVLSRVLTRTFTVSTSNVTAVATATGEVTQLLKDGISITSYRPAYSYSKIADLKVQILGEAAKDARTRADEIVRNSGGSVGAVREARMSPLQITRPDSTDVSGEGVYDTSTIEKDIMAVVTITFGVGA